ncbi:MAG: hypothetical protein M1826_000173 [Phylliscum demangeonii]|nr:MAG: hypothetical protein M1826_000173 [Phylliscum demangeonii]
MLAGLTSAGFELLTTSGVCIKSREGKKFVTCAAHGFSPGTADVYHPACNGQKIGRLLRTLGSSDISLFELENGFTYSRETFSETDVPGRPFRALIHSNKIRVGDCLSLNSPFNGLCEATFIAEWLGLLPSDEPGTEHTFFQTSNSDRFLDGCGGAPVWTDDFDVLGQSRFANKTGEFAYLPSYSDLVDEGFELSCIE